jgi:hypothetical protein
MRGGGGAHRFDLFGGAEAKNEIDNLGNCGERLAVVYIFMQHPTAPLKTFIIIRHLLVISAVWSQSVIFSSASDFLINHTFDDGAESLNGAAVKGGSLQTGSLEWIAAPDVDINRNGNIRLAAGTVSRRALIDLNSAITKGGKDDIYTLKVVAVSGSDNSSLLTGGFFTSTGKTPDVLQPHDAKDGIAWWFWRAKNGEMKVSVGPGFTAKDERAFEVRGRGEEQTFITVLDFTGYNGADNLGTIAVYVGETASGDPSFTTKFVEDHSFDYVGFTAQRFGGDDEPMMDEIKSLTLSKGRSP